jgi:hypothetical protein
MTPLQNQFAATVSLVLCLAYALNVYTASIDYDARVALQSALRSYIANITIDGHYNFVSEISGDAQILNLKKIDLMNFKKEGEFSMCADFINQHGQGVLIDYIVVSKDRGFEIEKNQWSSADNDHDIRMNFLS